MMMQALRLLALSNRIIDGLLKIDEPIEVSIAAAHLYALNVKAAGRDVKSVPTPLMTINSPRHLEKCNSTIDGTSPTTPLPTALKRLQQLRKELDNVCVEQIRNSRSKASVNKLCQWFSLNHNAAFEIFREANAFRRKRHNRAQTARAATTATAQNAHTITPSPPPATSSQQQPKRGGRKARYFLDRPSPTISRFAVEAITSNAALWNDVNNDSLFPIDTDNSNNNINFNIDTIDMNDDDISSLLGDDMWELNAMIENSLAAANGGGPPGGLLAQKPSSSKRRKTSNPIRSSWQLEDSTSSGGIGTGINLQDTVWGMPVDELIGVCDGSTSSSSLVVPLAAPTSPTTPPSNTVHSGGGGGYNNSYNGYDSISFGNGAIEMMIVGQPAGLDKKVASMNNNNNNSSGGGNTNTSSGFEDLLNDDSVFSTPPSITHRTNSPTSGDIGSRFDFTSSITDMLLDGSNDDEMYMIDGLSALATIAAESLFPEGDEQQHEEYKNINEIEFGANLNVPLILDSSTIAIDIPSDSDAEKQFAIKHNNTNNASNNNMCSSCLVVEDTGRYRKRKSIMPLPTTLAPAPHSQQQPTTTLYTPPSTSVLGSGGNLSAAMLAQLMKHNHHHVVGRKNNPRLSPYVGVGRETIAAAAVKQQQCRA